MIEAVLPHYGERSLTEVLPSVVSALGLEGWANPLGLPAARSYVVCLVDGLGWELLRRNAESAPYLSSLAADGRPMTCGVPSTTATSLTSLGTGLPPGAHGVVGFTSRIPGTDRLLDALRWDSQVDPRLWQPHPTVFGRAASAGLDVTVVSKRSFHGSGLTDASQRGANYIGADSHGERISAAVRASSLAGSLTYVYEGDLDATGHRRGSTSWAWQHELAMIDLFVQRLRESLDRHTALVVVADHGMVDVEQSRRLDVDDQPHLLEGVTLFGGEARFRHLYCTVGAVDEVAAAWRQCLGDDAWVLTRDEAIDQGWWGRVQSDVRPRLGDVQVASRADIAVVSTKLFPYEARLVGLHGSLTAAEMLVPLLVAPPG